MNDASLIRSLLTDRRVLALAVLDGSDPAIGLLPFAFEPSGPGGPALVVHASALARHSRGLQDGAPFDALLSTPEGPDVDPFRVPRMTLRGRVRVPPDGSAEARNAQEVWAAHFPEARALLGFGDFRTCRLVVDGGRVVAGFAAARDVGVDDLPGGT